MTIAAVNAVVTNVVLVAERNRLGASYIDVRNERSRIDFVGRPYCPTKQEKDGNNTDFRQAICAAVKDLCHGRARPDNIRFFVPT